MDNPTPTNRGEQYLDNILRTLSGDDVEVELAPQTDDEKFYDDILKAAGGDEPLYNLTERWRHQWWLRKIAEAIAAGGGGGGGSSVPRKDVNFIDYDGTVLYAYTAAEFAELDAMPDNPTHDGLTGQGWNMSLAQAKAQVTASGKCDVGQMYTTADGKTRLYITIPDNAPSYARTLELKFAITSGSVTVDYGDGSDPVDKTSSSVSLSHDYANTGDYVITLTVNSGTVQLNSKIFSDSNANANRRSWLTRAEIGSSVTSIGSNAFYNCSALQSVTIPNSVTSIGSSAFNTCCALQSVTIPNSVTSIESSAFSYCYALQSVTIPNSVTSIGSAFYSCYALQSVTIPNSVTSIESNAFYSCYALQSVTIPNSVTSIGSGAFYYCYALQSVTIPDSVTSIGSSAFNYCSALQSVTIPNSVASIGSSAFYSCYGLRAIHFKPTTPPTVDNSNAWSNLQASCKIYVPTGKLSAYTGATNYPSSVTYTYVEE